MQKWSSIEIVRVCFFICLVFFGCGGDGGSEDTDLVSVVAISRHGIRSPLSSPDSLNLYTQRSQGFPLWPTPADVPGNLSTWGQENVTRLGSWYRDFYAEHGVLPPRGTCPAAGTVFVYADVFERTIHTAQGYVDGMFQADSTPNCGVEVIHSEQQLDPFIATAAAGVCRIDSAVDLAAFNHLTGGNLDSLKTAFSHELEVLQKVTQCCQPAACATAANPNPLSCSILELPNVLSVSNTGQVGFASGTVFDIADGIAETFQLEYAQGMPDANCASTGGAQCVGWGVIPPGGLDDMIKLHVMSIDMTCRLPSFAQVGSSNLMWQLIGTMDQTLSGVKNVNILAPTASRFTLFVAHDENLSAIAAFLGGVTWKADEFQRNDPDPAGALVFELHRAKESGELIVKLFYVTATLNQMRDGTVLTLQEPPQRIPLEIPACGGFECSYDQFKTFINNHVRRDCLVTTNSTL